MQTRRLGGSPQSAVQFRGERKQTTVLAVDVLEAGLANLDADPEEEAERQQQDVTAITTAITRYGGEVKLLPDGGLVALFGAPLAFEDHAVRACAAALELRRMKPNSGRHAHRHNLQRGGDPT